jgi:hypothetical protein
MQRLKLHFTGKEELWVCCVELTVMLEVEFIEVQASKIFPFVCHEGIGGMEVMLHTFLTLALVCLMSWLLYPHGNSPHYSW